MLNIKTSNLLNKVKKDFFYTTVGYYPTNMLLYIKLALKEINFFFGS